MLTIDLIVGLSIYADPLIEKVFYNLLENALRHGKGVTRIIFSSFLCNGNLVIVCEDNGPGVPARYKEDIFNRQHFEHTGLGLFLSREILGITGLSIRECGEPGRGARFEITVPPGSCQSGHVWT
jgi:K+-sensing histidine kinase KdpD